MVSYKALNTGAKSSPTTCLQVIGELFMIYKFYSAISENSAPEAKS